MPPSAPGSVNDVVRSARAPAYRAEPEKPMPRGIHGCSAGLLRPSKVAEMSSGCRQVVDAVTSLSNQEDRTRARVLRSPARDSTEPRRPSERGMSSVRDGFRSAA